VFVPFVQNATNKQEDYPEDNTQLVIKSDHLSITLTDQPDPEPGSQDEPVRNVSVVGDVNVTGNINVTGDIAVDGKITATGNIESQGTIKAKGNVESTDGDIKAGSVSLKNHTHNFNYVGAGQGSTPQSGTTQGAN
jgi:hypothetical protein